MYLQKSFLLPDDVNLDAEPEISRRTKVRQSSCFNFLILPDGIAKHLGAETLLL